jgi:hypothetical protein
MTAAFKLSNMFTFEPVGDIPRKVFPTMILTTVEKIGEGL